MSTATGKVRRGIVVTLVLTAAALAGCEKKSDPAALLPTRAAQLGQFPDNPLLAAVPGDTPYVFATFTPLPTALVHKVAAIFRPVWRRVRDEATRMLDEEVRAVIAAFGRLTVQLLADARGVVLWSGMELKVARRRGRSTPRRRREYDAAWPRPTAPRRPRIPRPPCASRSPA